MRILLTGSVAIDYLMTFPGYFKEHILPDRLATISLSFLVDSLETRYGGIASNIAYAMALLGEKPGLWAAVGEDFSEFRSFLQNTGVDTAGAREFPGVKTASFFVNTDRDNNQIASFYPGAMAYAGQMSLKSLELVPDLVVISPNDPEAMRLYVRECKMLGINYFFDPSQQIVRMSKDDLIEGIEGSTGLFGNDYEAALVENITGMNPMQIAAREAAPDGFINVVTRGPDGAEIYVNGEKLLVPVVSPSALVDPTGVGDAFRGGFLTGLARGKSLQTCGKMGALIAAYCLENLGTMGYSFTPSGFSSRFEKEFGEPLDIFDV